MQLLALAWGLQTWRLYNMKAEVSSWCDRQRLTRAPVTQQHFQGSARSRVTTQEWDRGGVFLPPRQYIEDRDSPALLLFHNVIDLPVQ